MRDSVSDNENDGSVQGIAIGNQLGTGIRTASLPELGNGGSWSTCAIGCNKDPPQDVAHVQFRSRIGKWECPLVRWWICSTCWLFPCCVMCMSKKEFWPTALIIFIPLHMIAFKLVWCPTESFDIFVLVDDDGKELAHGKPTGRLPSLQERQVNYKIVAGSKYAIAADKIARGETSSTA